MSIREILGHKGRHVETIASGETVKAAAVRMRDMKIAALVVKDGDAVRGTISEKDIVQALATHGGDAASIKVRDVMSKGVTSIDIADSVKRAMRMMTNYRLRHLLVTDSDGVAGIVSIGDVVKNRLGDLELETNVLRDAYIAAH